MENKLGGTPARAIRSPNAVIAPVERPRQAMPRQNAMAAAAGPGQHRVVGAVTAKVVPPAFFLKQDGRNPPDMPRRPDQNDWPDEPWRYLLADCRGRTPPKLMRENGVINIYPIDMPRRFRNAGIVPPANQRYLVTKDIDALLAAEDFDPNFKGLDLNLVRESLLYGAYNHVYPPAALHIARATDRILGRNDGNDCGLCYGCHYYRYCPVVPLARHRIQLMEARGCCLACRGVHDRTTPCPVPVPADFICQLPNCYNEPHLLELCPVSESERERRSYYEGL